MDSLITAAARALAPGAPVGALAGAPCATMPLCVIRGAPRAVSDRRRLVRLPGGGYLAMTAAPYPKIVPQLDIAGLAAAFHGRCAGT
jgi:hypothetical protein